MRYLRMLSNSLAAALLATCYVMVLILLLNPALSSNPLHLGPFARTVGLFYVMHLAVIFYVLLVFGQLVARDVFSPAWISVSVLSWLGAAAAAGGAVLMWANVRTFGIVLEPATAERMTTGGVVLAGSAALFVIVAVARRYAGANRALLGACLVLIACGSVAVPAVLRGHGRLPPLESHPISLAFNAAPAGSAARITLVAIDGGSLDLIVNATAEGRLPNFGRILDTGAVMHLATLHPTSAEAVWTAVASGKLPQKNGVRSAGIYRVAGAEDSVELLPQFCFANGLVRFGFLSEEPYTSAALRTRTLWSILSTFGIPVGVVNWPLTYPARAVRGYLVSDLYERMALTPSGIQDPSLVYPWDVRSEALPIVQAASNDQSPIVTAAFEGAIEERHRQPGRIDRVNDRIADALAEHHPPQVDIVRYQSLDPIGHYFLRYATPSAFGDVSEEERRALGPVLERHYAFIDEALGRAIERLGPDDLLLVVSGYGMEPLGLAKRMLERTIGDPDLSGTHETAPDGFLMAYGSSVARSRSLRRASVLDVAPTVLYFLGLPIGRDMDGYARVDLFEPSFTRERPLTFIPSHDR